MIKRLLLFFGMMSCVLAIAGCSAQKKPGEADSDQRAENAANNVSPEPEQTPPAEAVTTAFPVEPEQTSPPEDIFDRIPTEGNVWKINEMERTYGIRPHTSADFKRIFHEMTREDVLNYFGMELDLADFLPELHEDPDAKYGFYEYQLAGSSTGIEPRCHFYYHGDETYPGYFDAWTQEITVGFEEGSLSYYSSVDYYLSEELSNNWEPEVSVVQGQKVRIVHVTVKREEVVYAQYYFADFLNRNLGVTIEALRMEEEDIKKVIEYLVFYALKREEA